METLEIISAVCLILACIFIIIMVLMQDSKRGMSQALAGGASDNFYQKNQGRSKEQRLVRATRTAAIMFFIVTLVTNVFAIYFKDAGDSDEFPPAAYDESLDFSDFDFSDMFPDEDFAIPDPDDDADDNGGYDAGGDGQVSNGDNDDSGDSSEETSG
jgi:preprotein translocase subunit SecG